MAERRMISRKIVDTDEFVDMPVSARLLYYEFNWRADDDGFVSSPRKIARMAGCSEDDMKILIAKQFIIPFNSGVVLIRDWRIHNYIRVDRYSETLCKDEKEQITLDPNNRYTRCHTNGIPDVTPMVTTGKDRLGEDRLGKDSISADKLLDDFSNKKTHKIQYEILNTLSESLSLKIREFIEFRKLIKAQMTDHAVELLIEKLNKLSSSEETQMQIIDQSILNSWKGVFEIKAAGNQYPQSKQTDAERIFSL